MKRLLLFLALTACFQYLTANTMETKRILIVYATSTNSTKEIADSIKIYLENLGHSVDLLPASGGKVDFQKYNLVIIGSAIQANTPLPSTINFIDANRAELSKVDVAIFAVCATITSSKKNKYHNALTYPDKVAHGLKPISKNVFGGNFPSNGKKFDDFMGKLLLGIVPGDYRDWEKIKEWVAKFVAVN
jgi:menaquinone-dependent protoporphyrinogen IX oxidase